MKAPLPFGRPRALNDSRRAELLELVSHGASVEDAALVVGVSVRTVQREARKDECFDHDLQAALQNPDVDCEKLMLRAARTHWRAAAWMLERREPHKYSKRPPKSCSPENLLDIMAWLIESALEATPPEHRAAVYRHTQAAADKAFDLFMPDYYASRAAADRFGNLPTPLSDQQTESEWLDSLRPGPRPEDDQPEKTPFPLREPAAAPAENPRRGLHPNPMSEASPTPIPLSTTIHGDLANEFAVGDRSHRNSGAEDPERLLSPKTSAATKVPATQVPRTVAGRVGAAPTAIEPRGASTGKISPLDVSTNPGATNPGATNPGAARPAAAAAAAAAGAADSGAADLRAALGGVLASRRPGFAAAAPEACEIPRHRPR